MGVFLGFSSKVCIKTAPSASFPCISASVKGTSASFPSIWGKIRQDSSWCIHQDESWRILPPNARKRSTGALHRGRNAGKRSTDAVLRTKIEFLRKYSVCRAGHFKLQKIAFEKISSIFSVFYLRYFWVRNSVPWPEVANRAARMENQTRKTAISSLVARFAISGHGTEFLTQK